MSVLIVVFDSQVSMLSAVYSFSSDMNVCCRLAAWRHSPGQTNRLIKYNGSAGKGQITDKQVYYDGKLRLPCYNILLPAGVCLFLFLGKLVYCNYMY